MVPKETTKIVEGRMGEFFFIFGEKKGFPITALPPKAAKG